MLFNFDLWLDRDGGIIAVNYQSKVETKTREELIAKEKHNLYKSIKVFKETICVLETKQYRIRIDDWDYRYTSWHLKDKMSDKPYFVIVKGGYIHEGSGGNHKYQFKKGGYTYECEIIIMGENDSPPALLTIYKSEKEILSQRAKLVTK
jgi:hypothetical protein